MKRIKAVLFVVVLLQTFQSYSQQYELENEFVVTSGNTVNVKDIKVDSDNNTIITGFYADSVEFGSEILESEGGYDIYVAKLDNNNKLLWAKSFGSAGNDYSAKLMLSGGNKIVVSGTFNDTFLESKDKKGAYIMRLSEKGEVEDKLFFSGSSYIYIDKIEQDFQDNMLITGFYRKKINVDGKAYSSTERRSAFISSVSNGLSVKWFTSINYNKQLLTDEIDYVGNKVSVSGRFRGVLNSKNDTIKSEKLTDFRLLLNEDGSHYKLIKGKEIPAELKKMQRNKALDQVLKSLLDDLHNDVRYNNTLLKKKKDVRKNAYALVYEDTKDKIENHHHLKKYNNKGEVIARIRYKLEETDMFSSKMDIDRTENVFVTQSTLQNGVHKLKLSKYFNCSNREFNIADDRSACKGDTLPKFQLPEDISTYVYNGDVNSTLPEVMVAEESSSHSIVVEDKIGCVYKDKFSVTVNPKPELELGENISVPENSEIELIAKEGFRSYEWSTGNRTNTTKVTEGGNYSLKVTNHYGCNQTDNIQVNFTPIAMADISAEFDYTIKSIYDVQFNNMSKGYNNSYGWNFASTSLSSRDEAAVIERSRGKRSRGSREENPLYTYNNKSFKACLTTSNSSTTVRCTSCKDIKVAGKNNKLSTGGQKLKLTCSPNPVKETTLIEYTIPMDGKVEVSVYTVEGVLLETLFSETLESGTYNYIWEVSPELVSGTYVVTLRLGERELVSERVIVE